MHGDWGALKKQTMKHLFEQQEKSKKIAFFLINRLKIAIDTRNIETKQKY